MQLRSKRHRDCRICGEPIVLVPSATERAIKYGGVPSDYIKLFDAHSSCALKERSEQVAQLIKRNTQKS